MLADQVDYVVGVDTHRDEHVLAVVVASTGAVVAQRSVATTSRGYGQALRFAAEHAAGRRVWAVEGAGHYGAGLARHLSGRGETVLEAGRSPRNERRLQGKDDGLDAIRAARTVLSSETLALPRAGQRREALRLLMVARRSAVDVRREALVQLRSVIVTAPDELRQELRGLTADAADRALQPPAPLQQPHPGRARRDARAAHPRPPHPGSDRGSRRAANGDPRPRAGARTHGCSTSPASARSSPPS